MGLDLVELVMEVEERFGVHLPDEECANARTVAALAALVISKLEVIPSGCPTSQAFYRVRRALVDSGLPREQIRPNTQLSSLDPRKRRRAWRKLERGHVNPRLRGNLQGIDTIGNLVRRITPDLWPTDASDRILAEYQVLEAVREIASEQLGIPLNRIHTDSDFVKDLGAG